MEAKDFTAWIDHMGISEREVARVLELSRNTVAKYKVEGAPAHIGFACAALAFGLPAWRLVHAGQETQTKTVEEVEPGHPTALEMYLGIINPDK